ncbi:MAG TPA: ester cyclase [Candidatus Limnocylindrales bacterium]|jgi:predicted ester cyclase|nr:ester cyclase [Candidatus Limnocylindrales bacterium]
MTTDELAGRARRIIEDGFGRGDLAVLDDLMAPDIIEHQRGNGQGIDGAKDVVSTLHRWMSDFELSVEALAVDGDIVWTRNRAQGVNTGPVMGHPPTGRHVEVDVFDVLRFENGRLVEHWGVADQLGLLLQLGIVPAPGERVAASVG